MTEPLTQSRPGAADDPQRPSRLRRSRRRPAPPAHPFFRFGFPVLVLAAAVAVVALWFEGTRAVLDLKDGREVGVITDPAAPGFRALVEPTPTMLIAHVDESGALVGVTVLSRTALDEGGALVVLSPDLVIDGSGDDDAVLAQTYEAEGGAGLERVLGDLFEFGFTDDSVVMDPEALGQWLRLVEPVPFRLTDDLVQVDAEGVEEVAFAAGAQEFDGESLAAIYGWRNPTEVDANRFTRQEAIWEAWLVQIGGAEDVDAATLPFEDGLSPYLRALGTGTADVALAPMAPVPFDPANPIYTIADPEWPPRKGLEIVPLPIGHAPGARASVQVLDGTGDPTSREQMIPVLVAAGAEISVIGNAATFDIVETSVAYHRAEHEAIATDLARAIDAPVVFVEDPNQPAELTVTIGSDRSDP